MSNVKTKQNSHGVAIWLSLIALIIAFGIFIYNSTTGYLAGQTIDLYTIIFSSLAIVVAFILALVKNKWEKHEWAVSLLFYALAIFTAIAIAVFAGSRVDLAADIYFIPVNYPATEETALYISFVALGFYVLAFIFAVYAGFGKTFRKKAA